jgi:N-acetylglucosaminyldiphosphoundecaprenol N-acetyl-beta-D-mannosaminyltransferase
MKRSSKSSSKEMNERIRVIDLHISRIGFTESIRQVLALGNKGNAYVCFANVHMVMECHKDANFCGLVNNADLVLADGQPIAKACKWLYGIEQERIDGMSFTPQIIAAAAAENMGIFLYGSTQDLLSKLETKIKSDYPSAIISGMISPPFRTQTAIETEAAIKEINASGAKVVLVSLGCPKQEKWMAMYYQKINAVLLGVGGAFAVMAGIQKRAPVWMQSLSLEWLYRLAQEPGRLFKRYLITNTGFIYQLSKAMLKK